MMQFTGLLKVKSYARIHENHRHVLRVPFVPIEALYIAELWRRTFRVTHSCDGQYAPILGEDITNGPAVDPLS